MYLYTYTLLSPCYTNTPDELPTEIMQTGNAIGVKRSSELFISCLKIGYRQYYYLKFTLFTGILYSK